MKKVILKKLVISLIAVIPMAVLIMIIGNKNVSFATDKSARNVDSSTNLNKISSEIEMIKDNDKILSSNEEIEKNNTEDAVHDTTTVNEAMNLSINKQKAYKTVRVILAILIISAMIIVILIVLMATRRKKYDDKHLMKS